MARRRAIIALLPLMLAGCGWWDDAPEIPQRKLDPDVIAILQHAAGGSLSKVKALLEKNPALVNAMNHEGETPLYRAVQGFGGQKASVELVVYLLEKGAQVNPPRTDHAYHPLHAAVYSDRKIIAMLLDRGADVNAKDFFGRTALDYARVREQETCELLLSRGATLTIADAAALGKARELREMLDKDPKLVNAQDVWDMTPLHYAARNNQIAAAKLLLKRGADPRKPMREGLTPLDLARNKNHREMTELLSKK